MRGRDGSRQRTPGVHAAAGALAALLVACASAPRPQPVEPRNTLAEFSARRLESLPGLPPAVSGWDRAQWLAAALALNPQLAEERAEVRAVAAGERTAAERPNPTMQLFGEYLTAAAASPAWLYGVSMEFLLRRPGERDRARQQAALQTALARSQLSESIWDVRAALRLALLEAAASQAEAEQLARLVAAREALLASDHARLAQGDIGRGQLLSDELELGRARQREQQARARATDARARLASAVGVPAAALEGVPVRWEDWAAIDRLGAEPRGRWREEALIGRPQIVGALREYDLSEVALRGEVAKRWPQLRLTPAYAWGGDGVEQGTLNAIQTDSGLGVAFELPIFNQHQGAIGEALGRRAASGEHLKAVQAQIFGEIDRAELAWPVAQDTWAQSAQLAQLADGHARAQQRALASGAADRSGLIAAQIVAIEARLAELDAAYAAQLAFGTLEDAYRRPLDGNEDPWAAEAPRA